MGGQTKDIVKGDPENEGPEEVEEEEEEEELVDPMNTLKEECKQRPEMTPLYNKMQECEDRIAAKTVEWEERGMPEKYPEHCQQELFDIIKSTDACMAKDLFKHLK